MGGGAGWRTREIIPWFGRIHQNNAYTGTQFITLLLLDCLINWLISSVS